MCHHPQSPEAGAPVGALERNVSLASLETLLEVTGSAPAHSI